jgi:hypothetical protein
MDSTDNTLPKDVTSVPVLDECLVAETCIDRFLWVLYQRAPKLDQIEVCERREVTVKKRGRLVTVTQRIGFPADSDFGWKDPKAATKAGMPLMDYVIGGMDRSFKSKLFYTLYAAEQAGLSPGITSGFRDDYRQSPAAKRPDPTCRTMAAAFMVVSKHGRTGPLPRQHGETSARRFHDRLLGGRRQK